MHKAFISFIEQENLFSPAAPVLLTVSGGVDSAVMCELFHQAGFHFAIAHCNFQLRAAESDADETFVKKLAAHYKVPLYTVRFNTLAYAKQNKRSIQVAARELRYQWFEEIRQQHRYTYIATAHHQNDAIETFFINLLRGAGISGLRSILPKQQHLIRPLLFASKQAIIAYAAKNKLAYREDSSNASDKYLRNQLRHHVMPLLNELYPSFENALTHSLANLRATETVYLDAIQKAKKTLVTADKNGIRIPIKKLKKLSPAATYLFETLKSYNFNAATVHEITKLLDAPSGKLFYSPTHRLIKDREFLLVEPLHTPSDKNATYTIKAGQQALPELQLCFNTISNKPPVVLPKSEQQAALDFDKLSFPLKIRRWKTGDRFQPLGMKGQKKLSDFFIDKKLSIARKENTWVLCSGNKIAWVIGLRIDDHYKVSQETKKIFFIEIANPYI